LREYDAPITDGEDTPEVISDLEDGGQNIQTERGVHARVNIPEGTMCMLVPRKCLITVNMGKELPIGQRILEADLDLHTPRHMYIMLYILWDRKINGESSFFHPYYEILPKTFQNNPIMWSEVELAWLKGSFLEQEIESRVAAIEEDYNDVLEAAPDLLPEICDSIEDFKWARMVVTSRNFAFEIEGERVSALVPHADMMNHRRPCETLWTFDDHLDGFTITT
jgi:histone-lysine N-methyltransferase SETD3